MDELMMRSMQVPNCGRGLSILVVDHDTTSLMYLASMLEQYSYKVTTTELASVAISLIRQGSDRFKFVMVDINVDDINSLSFLRILLKTDIPIILMSSERSQKVIEKAIAYGACLHLEKPISMNDLKYLWQHAYRRSAVSAKSNRYFHGSGIDLTTRDPKGKNKNVIETDGGNFEANCITTRLKKTRIEQILAAIKELKHGGSSSKSQTKRSYEYDDKEDHTNGNRVKSNPDFSLTPTVFEKKKSTEEGTGKEKNNQSRFSKPRARRLVWNQQLQHKFVAALTALGDEKARPKSILKMMNEPNLTHRQVASHLQKYKAQMQSNFKASPSNLTSVTHASTRIYSKPGFFYMLQKSQPTLSHPGHKHFNISSGGTFEFPKLPQDSTAHFSSQYQNQQFSIMPQEMPPKLHVPLDSTDSISSLNQKLNFNVGFEPIYSRNQTLQLSNMSQSMHQKLNFTPGSTSTSSLVNQNQVLESLTQTAQGIDTIMPNADKSLTEITSGNPEVDTTARGVTSATLSENWNGHSSKLVDLLKVLDEEADECGGSAIAPHPAEVDQFCEWLKEAIVGNNELP